MAMAATMPLRMSPYVVVFAEKLFDGFGDMLLEGSLVGTALRGVLTVDEGVYTPRHTDWCG
jgi:hypothetical protein